MRRQFSFFRHPTGVREDLRLVRRPTGLGGDVGLFRYSAGVGEDLGFFGCGGVCQGAAWWRVARRGNRGNRAAGVLTDDRSAGGAAWFVGCSGGLIPTKWAVAER
jgi:hypothetical protein